MKGLDENEKPLFGSWTKFYVAVVIWLGIQIILYSIFTNTFS